MEKEWEELSEERKIEIAGNRFFNRYGNEEWAAHNSLYAVGSGLIYEDDVSVVSLDDIEEIEVEDSYE